MTPRKGIGLRKYAYFCFAVNIKALKLQT